MNKNKQTIIKLLGDVIIPLLGYFLWNWSLYFILLFYIIDLFVTEFLVHLKIKKIKDYSEKISKKEWLIYGGISFLCLIILVGMIHLSIKSIHPNIHFFNEIIAFLSYEEMGLAQGVILLPLIAFMGYTSYKTEFLIPQLFKKIDALQLLKNRIVMLGFAIIFAGFCVIIANYTTLSDVSYLISILVVMSAYQLYKVFTLAP